MEGLLVEVVVAYQDVVQCKFKESNIALLTNPEHVPECLLLATLCFLALILQKPTHPVNLGLLSLAADIFQLHPPYSLFQGCSLWETNQQPVHILDPLCELLPDDLLKWLL